MKKNLFLVIALALLTVPSLWAGHGSSGTPALRVRTTVLLCPACHFQNAVNARFCSHCGAIMTAEAGGIPCSSCSFTNLPGATFCGGCGRTLASTQVVYVKCPQCHNQYEASQSGCPSCSGLTRGRRPRVYEVTPPTYTTSQTTTSGFVIAPTSGCVNLDHFHKDDFDKLRKEYNISGHTNNQAFSRLIVDVKVNEKFAVILNTVQVRVDGRWKETTLGSRLTDGRNEFSVNVPQGATGLVCSFTHGRGSDVSVSLEN